MACWVCHVMPAFSLTPCCYPRPLPVCYAGHLAPPAQMCIQGHPPPSRLEERRAWGAGIRHLALDATADCPLYPSCHLPPPLLPVQCRVAKKTWPSAVQQCFDPTLLPQRRGAGRSCTPRALLYTTHCPVVHITCHRGFYSAVHCPTTPQCDCQVAMWDDALKTF